MSVKFFSPCLLAISAKSFDTFFRSKNQEIKRERFSSFSWIGSTFDLINDKNNDLKIYTVLNGFLHG